MAAHLDPVKHAPPAVPFPVPPGRFWAKLHPREQPREWHPLVAHSADVAAVLHELLAPGTGLARRLAGALGQAELRPDQRARLLYLAVLHDMGKTNHGFQTKARPAGERGAWTVGQRGHVKLLLESMGVPSVRQLVMREVLPVLGADVKAASLLWAGAISHHGRPHLPALQPNRQALWQADGSGHDPIAEMRRLVRLARRWSGLDDAADGGLLPVSAGFTHLFAGVLMLADWIGSTRGAFDLTPWADDAPDRYWQEEALPRAADACARIGVVPRTRCVAVEFGGLPLLRAIFPTIFHENGHAPTDLQAYAATMKLPSPGARLLIESETGSGKTEAALTLYARLRATGLVDGLMFALPTRATASAMHRRVAAALEGMYAGPRRPTLALAVGGQQPRLETTEPLVAEPAQRWDEETAHGLESWASSHGKKHLAAEVVVGTLDQVLLAGLPVNHAHLRLAALSRHLLVVDELHSYDRYMTAVLTNLLALHTGTGGIALFMSATLAAATRREFAGGPEMDRAASEDLPYPTLALCQEPGSGWQDQELRATSRARHIRWSTLADAAVLDEAVAAAQAGARVLVLCNTVRRARELAAALAGAGHQSLLWSPPGSPHAPPYHSRYIQPDRLALDDAVRGRFSKESAAVTGGLILVSTQVTEQSLDVDFDLLITDLCPMDVLLQRIGRLHRHAERDEHRPPAFRAPQARVVAPDGGFAPLLKHRAIELGWGENRPYRNYADGELTLQAITRWPRVEIPRDNRLLVESVYHADAREPLWADGAWSEYLCSAETAERNRAWVGEQAVLKFEQTYTAAAEQYKDNERAIRTRLGDETLRIALIGPIRCWYSEPAAPVQWIDLPAWALPPDTEPLSPDAPLPLAADEDGYSSFVIGRRRYRYTPGGWEWRDG